MPLESVLIGADDYRFEKLKNPPCVELDRSEQTSVASLSSLRLVAQCDVCCYEHNTQHLNNINRGEQC